MLLLTLMVSLHFQKAYPKIERDAAFAFALFTGSVATLFGAMYYAHKTTKSEWKKKIKSRIESIDQHYSDFQNLTPEIAYSKFSDFAKVTPMEKLSYTTLINCDKAIGSVDGKFIVPLHRAEIFINDDIKRLENLIPEATHWLGEESEEVTSLKKCITMLSRLKKTVILLPEYEAEHKTITDNSTKELNADPAITSAKKELEVVANLASAALSGVCIGITYIMIKNLISAYSDKPKLFFLFNK